MGPGARPGRASPGVVDAGVVLLRLDRRRAGHRPAALLLERSGRLELDLWISAVNLAEVLQHARAWSEATGADLPTLLRSFGVQVHAPDAEIARRVAGLASEADLSLADWFASATAEALGARLYTTDAVLARAHRGRRLPVTLL